MEMPEPLAASLREKLSKDLGYWARMYEEAVERIADETSNEENPYWGSSNEDACVIPGDRDIYDEMGGGESADQARRRAWELLVLADLADLEDR